MLQSWFGDTNEQSTSAVNRAPEAQAVVDQATQNLALYYYETCWFCGTVRSTIEKLGLAIELRDIHGDREHHGRLMRDGGSGTVPCLLIGDGVEGSKWMYESKDIRAYLEKEFGVTVDEI